MAEGETKRKRFKYLLARGSARFSVTQLLLLLAVVFVFFPLAVSTYWGYTQSRIYLTEAAFRNIRNVAALEALETLAVVRTAERLVPSIVTGNEHLLATMTARSSARDESRERRLSEVLHVHLKAKASENPSVDEFLVLSSTGALIGSSQQRDDLDVDLSESDCFEQGQRMSGVVGFMFPKLPEGSAPKSNELIHYDDLAADGPTGEPRLLVASPIRDGSDTFLGVFCARFNLDIQRRLFSAHMQRTRFATLYLLDEQERIVTGTFDREATVAVGERYSSQLGRDDLGRVAAEGRYEDASGKEMLVAYEPIPVFDWAIVVEAPVVYALADLRQLRLRAIVGSLVLLGVLFGCVVLAWRMVVLPLRGLAHASERMASGVTGTTVPPRGPSELVDLARAFNRMSLGLKESRDLLETRIVERTRELRDSQAFLELLLDSIDRRVVVVDKNLRIVKANAAATRMHGLVLVGECCCTAFEGASVPLDDCPIRRTFDTGQSVAEERSQRTLRGLEPVYVETYPILDAHGEVGSVVEIGRVVTAEMQLQQQIVHQEKMAAFGQLAAGVAHEIGNPIASIQSQLQLAQEDPEFAEQTLDVVKQQVERMDRILRQLVEFTRTRQDEIGLVSANEIIQNVAWLVEHHPLARSVSIEFELERDLPAVRVNEDHLVQVLLNLALNALDAIEEVGRLIFETRAEGGQVAIRVRDSGCGIDKADRPHVFEPFFSKKRKGRGTGLGLFVSRGIVEEMGGKLELESSDSSGTVFIVRVSSD